MKRIGRLMVLMFALVGLTLMSSKNSAEAQNPNLLVNPGFEEGYFNQDNAPELAVPNGWRLYWVDDATFDGFNGIARRPETVVWYIEDAPLDERPIFWRDGEYTLKLFKGGEPMWTAISQDVNLQRGARYRLIAPVYADIVERYEGGQKIPPSNPEAAGIRLGASTRGATWTDESQINYSGWFTQANKPGFYLSMQQYVFDFTATSGQMRVWVEFQGRNNGSNNGFFIDGLSLRKVADPPRPTNTPFPTQVPWTPTPTALPATETPIPATSTPTPTPTITPTPLPTGPWFTRTPVPPTETPVPPPVVAAPVNNGGGGGGQAVAAVPSAPVGEPDENGNIWAEIGAGDSVWSLAAKAGITLDQILEYNDLPQNQQIFVQLGQRFIVGKVEAAAPPEPPAEEAAPAEEAPAEEAAEPAEEEAAPAEEVAEAPAEEVAAPPEPTEPPPGAEICLKAYEDTNNNAIHDGGEALMADVAFTVTNSNEVKSNYISDGQTPSYCIKDLAPGGYRITRSKLPNEVLTTGGEIVISLTAGASAEIAFGSYLAADEVVAAEDTAEIESAASTEVSALVPTAEPVADLAASSAADAAATDAANPGNGILIAVIIAAVLLLIAILVIILSRRAEN